MNKKTKKIVAAAIVATTVFASGTVAYFNSKVSLDTVLGEEASSKLQITNGKVKITGKLNGSESFTGNWSYDVAKVSSNIAAADVEKNQSPDILGVNRAQGERAKIGAAVEGAISKARPGDAIVLGDASSNGGGLTITNESNLTVKTQLVFKSEAAKDDLKMLTDAGWVLYVNGELVDSNTLTSASILEVASGSTATIAVRLELPLIKGNEYQDGSVGATLVNGFDINNMFEVFATQENNPGWSEDGN